VHVDPGRTSSLVADCALHAGPPLPCPPSLPPSPLRFADKESHQIFLEPEGRSTPELYVQVRPPFLHRWPNPGLPGRRPEPAPGLRAARCQAPPAGAARLHARPLSRPPTPQLTHPRTHGPTHPGHRASPPACPSACSWPCCARCRAWSAARCCAQRTRSSMTTCQRTSALPAWRPSGTRGCSSLGSSTGPRVRGARRSWASGAGRARRGVRGEQPPAAGRWPCRVVKFA
jgi:hypothetical protein